VRDFEKDLYKYVDTTNPGLLSTIMEKKILDDDLKSALSRVIKEAKQQFVDSRQKQLPVASTQLPASASLGTGH